ncbi:MAG: hypothetical protein ACK59R_12805 [Pseudomonadota bacterium]|jgi:hypothetical protein
MARPRGAARAPSLRTRVAAEAARLLAMHDGGDPAAARRKAALRLGARDERDLPGASEIEAALAEHRRLFGGGAGAARLRHLREAALEALGFFAAFSPRLAGPVLDGTAGEHDPVQVHVHADDGGEVLRALDALGVRGDQRGRRYELADGTPVDATLLAFEAGGVPFEVAILPRHALHQPPRSRVDRRPQARASVGELRALLAGDGAVG